LIFQVLFNKSGKVKYVDYIFQKSENLKDLGDQHNKWNIE